MLTSIAYAQGMGGAQAGGAQGGGFTAFVPLILMFVIFYFLLIRPQQKKAKEHSEMLNALKKGDRVVTGGGIYGHIINTDANTLTVEIANNVRVKVARGTVSALVGEGSKAPEKSNGKSGGKTNKDKTT